MENHIFSSYVRDFVVLCLSETKRSSYDLTDLPGYVPKFRPCRNKGYALCGIHGFVIFVTDDIARHVYDIPNTSSELVHWLRFDKKLLGFEIILGSLYLPHESSKYNEEGIYEDIAEDVMYLNAHYDDPLMILTGDYNARTGVLDDFITIEDAVAECTGICDVALQYAQSSAFISWCLCCLYWVSPI